MYGVINYDNTGRIRCEECGQYFDSVGCHVTKAHSMSARDYKLKHGLKLSKPITSISSTTKALKSAANRSIDKQALVELGKSHRYVKGQSGRTSCSEQEKIEIRQRTNKYRYGQKD